MNLIKNKFAGAGFAAEESGTQPAFRTRAFTLVELLIVIAVIAILAALLMPAFSYVEKRAVIQTAQSELGQLETALDSYHSKFGFYPPDNTNATPSNLTAALNNQLYYELVGTTNIGTPASPNFLTLDNRLTNNSASAQAVFGVSGFMNCSRANVGEEDSVPAQSFLPALKIGQLAIVTVDGYVVGLLCSAANGDPTYQPIPGATTGTGRNANPWRYMFPGINNPNSYDLWLQIVVGGKTNLICNWKDTPQINAPQP